MVRKYRYCIMNNIHHTMEDIKKEFSVFEDERDKYIYLEDIAKL